MSDAISPPSVDSGPVIDRLCARIGELEKEIAIRDEQIRMLLAPQHQGEETHQ